MPRNTSAARAADCSAIENQRDIMRAAFTLLKNQRSGRSGGQNPLADWPFGPARKDLGDWMDFSLLPDYDAVSKYFYFSVSGGSMPRRTEFPSNFLPRARRS